MKPNVVVPAVFTAPWLWPILIVLFAGAVATDGEVHWEKRPAHSRVHLFLRINLFLVPSLVAIGLLSVAARATFPNGSSLLWALLGIAVMALSLILRHRAIQLLGPDFNGDLRTHADQVVISAGPYGWVRHPGYLGVITFLIGLSVLLAYWPLVVLAVLLLGFSVGRRINEEERINREHIPGYEEYTRHVRWRLVPGVW